MNYPVNSFCSTFLNFIFPLVELYAIIYIGKEAIKMDKKREMSPYEKTCMQRIQQLISEYCGGSQQRFVERTGLCKASVSQYVNGRNVPSGINAEKIAQAFHVDSAWVMGYDTIPPGIDESDVYMTEAMKLYRSYMEAAPNIRAAVQSLLGTDE